MADDATLSAEARFTTLVAAFERDPHITLPNPSPAKQPFGVRSLKTHTKIFAMLVDDTLVVKLPKARVDALVAAGSGERFDARRDGRFMKEWIVIAPACEAEWEALAHEACAFVASGR